MAGGSADILGELPVQALPLTQNPSSIALDPSMADPLALITPQGNRESDWKKVACGPTCVASGAAKEPIPCANPLGIIAASVTFGAAYSLAVRPESPSRAQARELFRSELA